MAASRARLTAPGLPPPLRVRGPRARRRRAVPAVAAVGDGVHDAAAAAVAAAVRVGAVRDRERLRELRVAASEDDAGAADGAAGAPSAAGVWEVRLLAPVYECPECGVPFAKWKHLLVHFRITDHWREPTQGVGQRGLQKKRRACKVPLEFRPAAAPVLVPAGHGAGHAVRPEELLLDEHADLLYGAALAFGPAAQPQAWDNGEDGG